MNIMYHTVNYSGQQTLAIPPSAASPENTLSIHDVHTFPETKDPSGIRRGGFRTRPCAGQAPGMTYSRPASPSCGISTTIFRNQKIPVQPPDYRISPLRSPIHHSQFTILNSQTRQSNPKTTSPPPRIGRGKEQEKHIPPAERTRKGNRLSENV